MRALGILLLLLAGVGHAQPSAVDQLQSTLARTHSLQGDFEQHLYDTQGELLESSSGQFAFQRPGRFYWQTTEPFAQLLVSDQHTLWLYDPDLQQVTVRPVDEQIRKTPAMLLADDVTELTDNFHVVQQEQAQGQTQFDLQPVDEHAAFTHLRLVFTDQLLVAVELVDGLGQRTVLHLLNTERNQSVAEERFSFQVPEGVDVLIE